MEKFQLDRHKIIRGLLISLAIGISAFLVIFLVTIDQDTMKSIRYIDRHYFILAILAIIFSGLIEAMRIKVVTRAVEEKIGFWQAVKVFYISFFLGGITPYFSGAIPSQVFLFTQQGIPVGKSTMIATVRPIIKSIIFALFTPILFLYFRESVEKYAALSLLLIVLAIMFTILILIVFALAVKNPKKLTTYLERLKKTHFLGKFLKKKRVQELIGRMMAQALEFNKSFDLLFRHRLELLLALFYTVLYWFFYFSIAPLLLLGMNIQLNYALVMAIQVLIFFLLPFIPTPGGSGAAEVGFASLFAFFVPANLLGIYVAGWRLLTFYFNMILGAVLSLDWLRKWIYPKT